MYTQTFWLGSRLVLGLGLRFRPRPKPKIFLTFFGPKHFFCLKNFKHLLGILQFWSYCLVRFYASTIHA
jgi:hypothetical protein